MEHPKQTNIMSKDGSWEDLPTNIIELVLSHFTKLSDLSAFQSVCKKWHYLLSDEKSDIWRMFCERKLPSAVLESNVLSNSMSYKAKIRAYYFAWDPNECSKNIYIKSNAFTLHRNPVAQSKQIVCI